MQGCKGRGVLMNQTQTTRLDTLFRQKLQQRDNYEFCPLCRFRFDIFRPKNVCHWKGRRYTKTRWSFDNCIIACEVCNNEGRDIEPELIRRGVDTQQVARLAKQSGKVFYDEILNQIINATF